MIPYLGFLVDFCKEALLLLEEKRQKVSVLVQSILASDVTDVKTLQPLSGKCISFSLAVPGARLFLNEINLAISAGTRSSRPTRLSGPLKSEIQPWTFLETWSGFFPWRTEFHHQFILCVDTSARTSRGAVSLAPTLSLLLFMTIGLILSATLISMQRKSLRFQMFCFRSRKASQTPGLTSSQTARSLLRPGTPSVGGLTRLFLLLSSFSALFRFRPLMSIWLCILLGQMPIRPLSLLAPCP